MPMKGRRTRMTRPPQPLDALNSLYRVTPSAKGPVDINRSWSSASRRDTRLEAANSNVVDIARLKCDGDGGNRPDAADRVGHKRSIEASATGAAPPKCDGDPVRPGTMRNKGRTGTRPARVHWRPAAEMVGSKRQWAPFSARAAIWRTASISGELTASTRMRNIPAFAVIPDATSESFFPFGRGTLAVFTAALWQ